MIIPSLILFIYIHFIYIEKVVGFYSVQNIIKKNTRLIVVYNINNDRIKTDYINNYNKIMSDFIIKQNNTNTFKNNDIIINYRVDFEKKDLLHNIKNIIK